MNGNVPEADQYKLQKIKSKFLVIIKSILRFSKVI